MSAIRLTKEFKWEMAHALLGYDGPCRNIHGHSYELVVTVIGVPSMRIDDPKLGMVMDFKDLKGIVRDENMLTDFAGRIQKKLPSHIKLHSLRLRETVTSYAEWFAQDQG